MSEWQEVRLGDICKIKGGKRLPKDHYVCDEDTGYPYLRVSDLSTEGFSGSNLKFITKEAFSKIKNYTISVHDIYISIAGTIGHVGRIPSRYDGISLTENCAKFTQISNNIDTDYLMYFLRSAYGRDQIESMTGGATQPKLALTRIAQIKIPVPPLPTQQKIAKILSNYDDLIENNLKRIKLLEESARLTYEEWFLRFRIDGKKLDIDSATDLPFGWEEVKLGDVCELNYGKALIASNRQGGEYPVYGSSGIVGQHNEYICNGKGIILGRKGNVGSVFWSEANFYPIDTCFYITSKISLYFIYFLLKSMSFINNDAAVPGLNRSAAYLMKCTIPDEMLVEYFTKIIKTLFSQIQNYENQNQLLKEARDILLPRLMTGMINTDELDIAV